VAGGATTTAGAGWIVVLSVVVVAGAGVGLLLLMHPDRANAPPARRRPNDTRIPVLLMIIVKLLDSESRVHCDVAVVTVWVWIVVGCAGCVIVVLELSDPTLPTLP
jgi:choline dehydrogenase-like flavoprotein